MRATEGVQLAPNYPAIGFVLADAAAARWSFPPHTRFLTRHQSLADCAWPAVPELHGDIPGGPILSPHSTADVPNVVCPPHVRSGGVAPTGPLRQLPATALNMPADARDGIWYEAALEPSEAHVIMPYMDPGEEHGGAPPSPELQVRLTAFPSPPTQLFQVVCLRRSSQWCPPLSSSPLTPPRPPTPSPSSSLSAALRDRLLRRAAHPRRHARHRRRRGRRCAGRRRARRRRRLEVRDVRQRLPAARVPLRRRLQQDGSPRGDHGPPARADGPGARALRMRTRTSRGGG